ncbi:MAG: hypothetical protein M1827_003874 [Pycnora praestabilis]|nr:MAG: hypothetical protein M1827_003874 [Pycnora praestabilis]
MTPTCIRFSASDHLAIGQMDSTVVILQHHFSTLLAFASQTQQFNANRSPIKRTKIELLAPVNTILQSKLIGPITNVMFSPQVPGTDDGSSWLSIGTKYSGLWLLNLRSSQISHILNHGGIDLGCLVWSDPFQEDDGSVWASTVNSTVQATRSASSGVALQTWSRAYGDSVDAALLNDFYTLRGPTGIDGTAFRTSLSEYRPEPGSTPIHQNHRSRMSLYGSSSSVTESPHSSNEGCSLLIGGMQDGTVCLRRTFHSSSMLRTESSFTFYAGQVAQNTRFLTKSNGLVAGAITNLALLPSRSAADADGSKSCSILITIANDRSSKIHVFTVRIPPPHLSTNTSQPDDNWVVQLSNEIMNHTATVTRSLANSLLSCITSAMLDQGLGTGYWAPSKHGRVCAKYLGARLVEPMNEAAVQFSLKTSINSLSANPTGTHVLAGVAHEKNLWGGECFLLNTATISDVAVNLGIEVLHTVTPFATSGSPKRSWPEDPQGFYSRLLSPSELALRRRKTRYSINDDVNESGETGTIAAHVVFGTHECEYGQVAFGVGGKGWVVSAAVYEPTTWSSSTPAICLFALNL